MSKYKYSEKEKQLNTVLKYQDDTLNHINESDLENDIEAQIERAEKQLKKLGIDPSGVKKQIDVKKTKKVMTVPSWENLYKEAETAVGSGRELESLFTEEELKNNERAINKLCAEYDQLHYLDNTDIAISAIASIIGAVVDILLLGIPKKGHKGLEAGSLSNFIRKKFDETFTPEEIEKLTSSKSNNVHFGAQNNWGTRGYIEGLSIGYHRLSLLERDPILGFFVGVFDIFTGRTTTIEKTGKNLSQAMENNGDKKGSFIFTALVNLIFKFKSEITTSKRLPASLMSVLNLFQFESNRECEQTVAAIVQWMHNKGYDFGHFLSMSIPVMLIEVIVRVSYALKRLKEGKEIKDSVSDSLNREKNPKLATMLFIAHAGATAVNAGKVYFTKNPIAINYSQWLTFAIYSYKQLKWIILEKPAARAAYVNGKLLDDWNEILKQTDEIFEDFAKDYIIVFE